jgi:hypothetical protein
LTIHNNIIYICEQITKSLYKIHTYDATYLDVICSCKFQCDTVYNNIMLYGDKIYNYRLQQMYVYDLLKLELIHTFDIEPFKQNHLDNHVTISNSIIILANNNEIMVYSI